MMWRTTWPTLLLLWAAVSPAVGGQEGQLLWELHLSPPDSAELPAQAETFAASLPSPAVQLTARAGG